MTQIASAEPETGTEARRELSGVTAGLERDVLQWMAARTPPGVGPDHLTMLGAAGMGLAGAAYAASGRWPWLLLVVNLGLAVNWLGDSLDGTLARYRRHTRPRYGHYVDHVVDAFGAQRIMWGSDFCQTHDRSYAELVDLGRSAFAELDDHDRQACMAGTALRLWPSLASGASGAA